MALRTHGLTPVWCGRKCLWWQPNNGDNNGAGVKASGIVLWIGSKSGFVMGNGVRGNEGTPGEDRFDPDKIFGNILNKSGNEAIVDWKGRDDGSRFGTIDNVGLVFNENTDCELWDGKHGWKEVFEAIKEDNKSLHKRCVRNGLLLLLLLLTDILSIFGAFGRRSMFCVFDIFGLIVEVKVESEDLLDNDTLGFKSDDCSLE